MLASAGLLAAHDTHSPLRQLLARLTEGVDAARHIPPSVCTGDIGLPVHDEPLRLAVESGGSGQSALYAPGGPRMLLEREGKIVSPARKSNRGCGGTIQLWISTVASTRQLLLLARLRGFRRRPSIYRDLAQAHVHAVMCETECPIMDG